MKVFIIREEVNSYQAFLPKDESVWGTDLLLFDCQSKLESWVYPKMYVLEPKLKLGNFVYLCPGALICDAKAMEGLNDILEIAGELLDLIVNDNRYYLLNVLQCINTLDAEQTVWSKTSTGENFEIETYSFYNRFTESSIFKIPETSRADILTYSGIKDPEDEFIHRYQQLGLKGLVFDELWSDENSIEIH